MDRSIPDAPKRLQKQYWIEPADLQTMPFLINRLAFKEAIEGS